MFLQFMCFILLDLSGKMEKPVFQFKMPKKKKTPSIRVNPFPLPAGFPTGWSCITGCLLGASVHVNQTSDVELLYEMVSCTY